MASLKCSKCGVEKSSGEFSPDKKNASGRKSQCRECVRAYQREARKSEEFKAKRRAYRKRPEVRAKESAYMKQWSGAAEKVVATEKGCSKCGETKPADGFSRNAKTSDGLASWCKACVAEKVKSHRQNPEVKSRLSAWAKTPKVKAWRAAYRKTDSHKAAQARYANSDKGKASRVNRTARRRLREELAGARLTGWDWRRVLRASGNACHYCRRPFTDGLRPTVDHKLALARGGTHDKDNIVPSCMHCNCSKRDGDFPVTLPDGTPYRITA
jgi:hypothetical protein